MFDVFKQKSRRPTRPSGATGAGGRSKALRGMSYDQGRSAVAANKPDTDVVGQAPVTGDASKSDWRKLKGEVADFEEQTPDALRRATGDQEALSNGEVLPATRKRRDGMIEEMTVGEVNCPYHQFVQKILPSEWSRDLAGYVGGDVDVVERDEQGRATRQYDRMVLETPMSKHLSWMGDVAPMMKHLDMTKSEEIDYGKDKVRVRWRVYMSDNETVLQDIGYVEFAKSGDKTRVTFHSAHAFTESYTSPMNYGPLAEFRDVMTAKQLREAFSAHIENYREVAEG